MSFRLVSSPLFRSPSWCPLGMPSPGNEYLEIFHTYGNLMWKHVGDAGKLWQIGLFSQDPSSPSCFALWACK